MFLDQSCYELKWNALHVKDTLPLHGQGARQYVKPSAIFSPTYMYMTEI